MRLAPNMIVIIITILGLGLKFGEIIEVAVSRFENKITWSVRKSESNYC